MPNHFSLPRLAMIAACLAAPLIAGQTPLGIGAVDIFRIDTQRRY